MHPPLLNITVHRNLICPQSPRCCTVNSWAGRQTLRSSCIMFKLSCCQTFQLCSSAASFRNHLLHFVPWQLREAAVNPDFNYYVIKWINTSSLDLLYEDFVTNQITTFTYFFHQLKFCRNDDETLQTVSSFKGGRFHLHVPTLKLLVSADRECWSDSSALKHIYTGLLEDAEE